MIGHILTTNDYSLDRILAIFNLTIYDLDVKLVEYVQTKPLTNFLLVVMVFFEVFECVLEYKFFG